MTEINIMNSETTEHPEQAIPGRADIGDQGTSKGSSGVATAAETSGSGDSVLEEAKERYLRLAAEYDNYRKRTVREVQQAVLRGQADALRPLLTSLDDLSRFANLDPATTDVVSVVEGVAMVEKNIVKALTDLGVEIIDPLELPFDPTLHEAISTQAAETPDEDHMVAQVYQRGYLLKGQLLRPARVVVKQYL